MTNTERGLRAVVTDLISHVDSYGVPAFPLEQADFIEKWGERILRATGYHRLQQQNAELQTEIGVLRERLRVEFDDRHDWEMRRHLYPQSVCPDCQAASSTTTAAPAGDGV